MRCYNNFRAYIGQMNSRKSYVSHNLRDTSWERIGVDEFGI